MVRLISYHIISYHIISCHARNVKKRITSCHALNHLQQVTHESEARHVSAVLAAVLVQDGGSLPIGLHHASDGPCHPAAACPPSHVRGQECAGPKGFRQHNDVGGHDRPLPHDAAQVSDTVHGQAQGWLGAFRGVSPSQGTCRSE